MLLEWLWSHAAQTGALQQVCAVKDWKVLLSSPRDRQQNVSELPGAKQQHQKTEVFFNAYIILYPVSGFPNVFPVILNNLYF